MNLFDADNPVAITRLSPTKDGWVSVFAGGKRVLRVPKRAAEELELKVEQAWTKTLADKCELAAETLKAKKKAVLLLKVRPRSSGEVKDRLVGAGFASAAVDAAVSELVASRAINDAELATAAMERADEQGRSARDAATRLRGRGISDDILRVVAPARSGSTELERAVVAARLNCGRIGDVQPQVKHRRMLYALARLGYDEDTAREAVERVLGFQDE